MSYPQPPSSSLLARALIPLGVLVLVAVGAAIFLFYLESQSPSATKPLNYLPNPAASPTPAPAALDPASPLQPPAEPAATAPEPAAPVEKPPAFTRPEDLSTALAEIPGALTRLMVPDEFVRKFTVAVYGASEGRVVIDNRPLVSPAGPFALAPASAPNQFRMLPQNSQRYDAYVAALAALNSDLGLRLYQQSYPLLQQAFEELGMGKRAFHQTLIIAVDNLLAAPDPSAEPPLLQPYKSRYGYLDPELERLPATHKLMLRLGPEHNAQVKQQLRSLRQRLVGLKL
jgi:hypothetical protein